MNSNLTPPPILPLPGHPEASKANPTSFEPSGAQSTTTRGGPQEGTHQGAPPVAVGENKMREIAVRVSQYFRDFLESDFKRAQAPRRRIVLTSESGFRSGMRTGPYPQLDQDLWKLLSRPSGDELRLVIAPRRYTRPISPTLRRVIEEHVGAIQERAIASIRVAVLEKAKATLPGALNDPEAWVDSVRKCLATEAATQIIKPLLAHLAGPLQSQAYWVMDSLYAAENDLVARVASDLDQVLPEVLAKLLATQDVMPLQAACEHQLSHERTTAALISFFDSFVAADAYHEFRDLETYVTTGDGLQLYLYMGAMKFGGVSYPVFYLPLEVERSKDAAGYTVKLTNRLFVNRRAIDFVLQELAAGMQREWVSPIRERINYLDPKQSLFELAHLLFRQIANALDLGGKVEFSSISAEASTASVSLSPTLHLAAFERADEALLNDFEEIIDQARQGGSKLVDLFHGMVEGVLMRNPVPIRQKIDATWDALPLVDRLVFDSPIPLNEEQRKVLLAVREPEGMIVVVEGPPGTGKSHTITAIAADCAFNKRSCLILSDKTEALDVVYDKLSEAMSRVRHDRDFPNPILRLGQQAANFKRLTSTSTVTQVGAFAKAMKANQPALEAEREETAKALKTSISTTVDILGSVSLSSVKETHELEAELAQLAPAVLEQVEAVVDSDALSDLEAVVVHADAMHDYLAGLFGSTDYTPASLQERLRRDAVLTGFARDNSTRHWSLFERLDGDQIRQLSDILLQYQQLRMPVFGYLFRGAAIRQLEAQISLLRTTRPVLLKADFTALQEITQGANALRMKLEGEGLSHTMAQAYQQLAHGEPPAAGAGAAARTMALFQRLNTKLVDALLAEPKDDPKLWVLTLRFLRGWMGTRKAFVSAPQFDYVGVKSQLERLNTSAMNAHVDGRLIEFMDRHRSDARALAGVISSRQKFPVDKFEHVRESFPVMIASIREFGEYMPLAPELFDVLVIDEGSQVSVAQALPALLRAKKVVILGDSKQFSNVKSANASIALNDKYRSDLVNYFRSNVSQEADVLERLAMFDVKRSVLEFCSLAASYSVMLRKHFRSYAELIGFSSSTFYNHQLQALKIRSKPISEVIRFSMVDATGMRTTRSTNEAEADFILERLLELVELPSPPTVGVITPFREQQTLLSKKLFNHARGRDFEERLRLKVMTVDSCQGEERQQIFYSMVATRGQDALNYIFPVSLEGAVDAVEDKLKVQRLNVGFSRAQESIWIVHSMPLDEFRGGIGHALRYYANALNRPEVRPEQTDPRSPMEAKVLGWLQQTAFVQAHADSIEILPQFPVGDYLRQLDPTYKHPAWRVDFLLTVQTDRGALQIVIEYDGFEYHFRKDRPVHVGNHERYLVEGDVERQLTLESYGYRFLRINRFNLGKDPVTTLSTRLERMVQVAGAEVRYTMVDEVMRQAEALANKDMKVCSRCEQIREQSDFYDPNLKGGEGGYGRICMECKSQNAT